MSIDRLTITEVAKQLGVTTKTIMRWEKAGKIKQAKRDWRGWRAYSEQELSEMKNLVQAVY
jgi:excisionase family DNA binding protein